VRTKALLAAAVLFSAATSASSAEPTAGDEAGSGNLDVGAIAIVSVPLDRPSLDANLWVRALGPGGSSSR
jgi:hypothetical protein